MNRIILTALVFLLAGCSKTMPPTEVALQSLKERMHQVRAVPEDVEKFKNADPATKIRMTELFFVAPVRAEGYNFDQTVRRYCQIALRMERDRGWHMASGMLSVWNDLRPELQAGSHLSTSTLSLYSSAGVQTAIEEKEKMLNEPSEPTSGFAPGGGPP